MRRTETQKDSWWPPLVDHVASLPCFVQDRLLSRSTRPKRNLHLAVMVEPYLTFVLEGKKTVESRFTANRCAPYGRVESGDIILLKRVSGPVCGACRVAQVWYYELDPSAVSFIRREFASAICAPDPAFWEARKDAAFATLIRITDVVRLDPIGVNKRDRRGGSPCLQTASVTRSFSTNGPISIQRPQRDGKNDPLHSMAEALHWKRVSCGDVVRDKARCNGMSESRRDLQDLGESWVRSDVKGFCDNLLRSVQWNNGENS